MQLANLTRFPADLVRTSIGEVNNNRFAAAVVARVTYDLTPEGPKPATDQPWIVSRAPWKNEHGQMDGDEVFIRGGVDIFLFGQAWAGRGQRSETEVVVEVGAFRRRVLVLGNRVWVRQGKALVPSASAPFRSMPLTLAHAFGGKDKWDGLEVSYPDNPDGKGYVLEEKDAAGKALPNLEDPQRRITRWNDRPDPVGFGICPMTCGLRLRNGITLNEQKQLDGIKPALFNSAFPDMIAKQVAPGDVVRVSNVLPTGSLDFRVPAVPFEVRISIDNNAITRPMVIDQLGIESERSRVFITYRYPFRYVMCPLQKRTCELSCGTEYRSEGGR
jgi:hypothetical protein